MQGYNILMQAKQYDYVIESVRYFPSGEIDFVRLYERRGPTYSDRELYPREKLVHALQANHSVATGQRISGLASTFQIEHEVHLANSHGHPVICTGSSLPEHDLLEDVPVL